MIVAIIIVSIVFTHIKNNKRYNDNNNNNLFLGHVSHREEMFSKDLPREEDV